MARRLPVTERFGTGLVGAALLAAMGVSWFAVINQAAMMTAEPMPMDGVAAAGGRIDSVAALQFVSLWLVMMVAMMLPSAAPMILLFRTVVRRREAPGYAALHTALFVAMYLLVWGAFGLLVYVARSGLNLAAHASPLVAAALPYVGVTTLVLAGIYQFTSFKTACLRQCRTPLDFLMARWRNGPRGALRLGVEHGVYCLGCCWGLMVVLVAAGAMGLAWVATIAAVVFVEKLFPRGEVAARLVGAVLLAVGAIALVRPEVAELLKIASLSGK